MPVRLPPTPADDPDERPLLYRDHEDTHHHNEPTTPLADPLSATIRPMTYYGDGPFDPPSSDEEDETLLQKDSEGPTTLGAAESGQFGSRIQTNAQRQDKQRNSALKSLIMILSALVFLSILIGIIAAHTYAGATYREPGVQRITMDHIFNGTFSVQRKGLNWVPEAGDGVFSQAVGGHIELVDLKTNTTTKLVSLSDIKNEQGQTLYIVDWKLSPDMKQILCKTDYQKQWRWSSFGNYYVHTIETKTTHALFPPSNPPQTAYATWSPTGDAIAFVVASDLYILPSAAQIPFEPIRLTNTGSATLFHGIPDWVYEEEIFSSPSALWFSPHSTLLAFLSFDETLVPEFTFPIYNPTGNAAAVIPYTTEVKMRYPKPGFPNPLVSVHVFDLDRYLRDVETSEHELPVEDYTLTLNWDGRQEANNSVIVEVAWVGRESLVVKEVNRNADEGGVVLFDVTGAGDASGGAFHPYGKVVRRLGKDGEQGDSGWVDNEQTIYPLPASLLSSPTFSSSSVLLSDDAYLDIVPTKEGYNHIALFSPADSRTPHFLTSGGWEVTGRIKGVDWISGDVYFEAASPSSTQRHIYTASLSSVLPSLSLPSPSTPDAPKALTDISKTAYYSSSFSPQAGFYVLNYQGPDVPWQKVVKAGSPEFDYALTTNERLVNATMEYESAIITHSTIVSEGYELNVKEYRPPRMDDSGRVKYPVLFRVYGGPHSQLVDHTFSRDWHDYVACGLNYIVVVVDGRGTGFKGRKLRNPVKGNLGFFETRDQIEAARIWADKEYVDPKRIGIWGWSYGGFMSAKVVEANAGIHTLAMSVAPVTSWQLYDSIYTERYMNLPLLNAGGYVNASISNVSGFHNVDYLLAHGSGDDNVHYANTAHLLDMFTEARVRGFRFRMFTDSDHSISRRGGQREVYEYLTGYLIEKWGRGGRRVG